MLREYHLLDVFKENWRKTSDWVLCTGISGASEGCKTPVYTPKAGIYRRLSEFHLGKFFKIIIRYTCNRLHVIITSSN